MLRPVGVEEFDEHVYRALLRHPDAAPDTLASIVGAPATAVGAALVRLAGLGLVRPVEQGRYSPNDPEPALAALVHRRAAELHAVRADAAELAADFRVGRLRANPDQLVEVVTGTDEIYRRTMELYQGAETEIMAFERPPYAVPPDFDEVAAELPLLSRGVLLRVVYSAEALAAPEKFDRVRALTGHGELARTLPELPLKLIIVDRRAARVSLSSDAYATHSVAIVQSSGLLDALMALFEAYWARAHPIGGGVTATGLSPAEARVLAMLAAGFKDEAIARHLRISMRTVGRRVEHILASLDAATRFQAGAQAARRNWL
ncbi:MAG TPA: LuxR C-terminal-related transcriptional regulator [Nonomuraea sp.]|nr:LuxR C-terminal-related transcriptional regulator [Nonomuraea sp.]